MVSDDDGRGGMDALAQSGDRTPTRHEHARLAVAAGRGDSEAFSQLVVLCLPGLHRYLVATGTAADEADDIVQDAFLRAYRSIGDFDPRWAFTTWLYTIAHRLRLNRQARRHGQVPLAAVDEPVAPVPMEEHLAANPGQGSLWELSRTLLPAKQAHALWLRYGEDLELDEIARILATTALNVRVMLHRARHKLARHARVHAYAEEIR